MLSGPGGSMNFPLEAFISNAFQFFKVMIVKQLCCYECEGREKCWDLEWIF